VTQKYIHVPFNASLRLAFCIFFNRFNKVLRCTQKYIAGSYCHLFLTYW